MKEKWSSFSSSLLPVPSKVEILLYLSLLWGESFCALKFPGQCQDTQVHLRDHTLCHKPCPALDIFNHSLNCKHRASSKEGVLLSLSLCCFGACRSPCFILWLCWQGWNLPQAWQQVHLHHCPWRVASARSQGCSWQTTCGEKSLLLTRSFAFKKCSFFPPALNLFFYFFLGCFLYYFLNALLQHLKFYPDPFPSAPLCFHFRFLAFWETRMFNLSSLEFISPFRWRFDSKFQLSLICCQLLHFNLLILTQHSDGAARWVLGYSSYSSRNFPT